MERFRLVYQTRRVFPYYLSTGLVLGHCKDRSMRRKPKSNDWYNRVVQENFDDSDWLENFRMHRETFRFICRRLEAKLTPSQNTVEEPLDIQKKVAITVYWLASSAEYRTIGNLFGVGTSTVCVCIHEVCEAVLDTRLDEYVIFPEGDDLKEVIKGYEDKWGFPNCGGAIDGSHIPIKAPNQSHGDYLNRKGFYSLILQGVCDHKYIFRDINIGWPGRVHDARVFSNSEVYLKGEGGSLFPNWFRNFGDSLMPVVLLGDPAYPLKTWLLKPYTNRSNLTPAQSTFNYRLSRARMTIENSFGRLKGRWRCLQKRLDVDVEFACSVIGVCVVLHNICETANEIYRDEWNIDIELDGEYQFDVEDGDARDILCAKALRDDMATAFMDNPLRNL